MTFDPSFNIIEGESSHLFNCYLTFVANVKGKKLSVQNVFINTLQDDKLKNILKMILSIEDDMEMVKLFLEYDPTLSKSKFVLKFLNSEDFKKQKK